MCYLLKADLRRIKSKFITFDWDFGLEVDVRFVLDFRDTFCVEDRFVDFVLPVKKLQIFLKSTISFVHSDQLFSTLHVNFNLK